MSSPFPEILADAAYDRAVRPFIEGVLTKYHSQIRGLRDEAAFDKWAGNAVYDDVLGLSSRLVGHCDLMEADCAKLCEMLQKSGAETVGQVLDGEIANALMDDMSAAFVGKYLTH